LAPPTGARAGQIAFKTGTSYGYRDAWALGFDGRHVIGVWIGRPDGTPVPGLSGASHAAPLLFDAFDRLKPGTDPLPPPPPETLLVATAQLPAPLRRFGADTRRAAQSAPDIVFPPDGAIFGPGPLIVKLHGGTPPFAVFANGRPVSTGLRRRMVEITGPGRGFSALSVIDAKGQTARVGIRVE
ncbi:MAG: penicillin-binding protein 1C, partial [Marinibacterium sp.]